MNTDTPMEKQNGAPSTLGDVLYAAPLNTEAESDWAKLVSEVRIGNTRALFALYDRSHRPAYTLFVRLTCDREIAEELTLDLYCDVVRNAASFEPSRSSVLAWVMNRARALALARIRRRQLENRGDAIANEALLMLDMPDYRHILHMREQSRAVRGALAGLSAEERGAVETTYFDGRDYVQAAAALQCSTGAIKVNLRQAMHKLARGLSQGPEFSDERIFYRLCDHAELASAYVLEALTTHDQATFRGHLQSCAQCRWEVDALRPLVKAFIAWPADLLRPSSALRERLADRLWVETGKHSAPPQPDWLEPAWETVAPGIACKLLAADRETGLVSMLVRLVPGGEYPPHTHAAVEELHLLEGELWIDDRKLYAGDYNRAEPGTGDKRVWSETGCACVLVTSARDVLS